MDKLVGSLPSALVGLFTRDPLSLIEWKGSWPEWKWHQSMTSADWLRNRRREEGAEGLWRIHNKLYDLSSWVTSHPGGKFWIEVTKGTDITEAFETHHLTDTPEILLPKFYIRDATTKRNSPFTFHENGFYKVLKTKVKNELKRMPQKEKKSGIDSSDTLTDGLVLLSLLLASLGAKYNSFLLCLVAAFLLTLFTVCAHNYFHKRDNWRMYYFNFSLLSFRDWRVSHALSHHAFPNTRYDLEVTMFLPWFQWFTWEKKTMFSRYVSWLYAPIAYVLIFHVQWLQRIFTNPDRWLELIPFVYPSCMFLAGGVTLTKALLMWQFIIFTSSFLFGIIGLNAAHHHPDIFHDGDVPREDSDWGLYQMDAVRDREDIKGCLPLVMVLFGDHSLHHLFPTLDHSTLNRLYPTLEKTCRQFDYPFTMTTALELFKGQFRQLARVQPHIFS